ncbi:uncharacterized protein SCHCODRAFT_02638488 [Schizophyllum commune H4-8]|uniref:uncharacterized protein n=1 Tax=Schizophyllum commune (strain H4-8 / FGSC 9210) TaxID=578458 RepID=UPI00215E5BEE|nr:uncharacterized protein SCHCODRAFT_02638488 [Schizophyllum commune H4-8]KAI5887563.1 hypothetical protein SCHCODRAFT_02638488 [Schizophyllum commune H4-8]
MKILSAARQRQQRFAWPSAAPLVSPKRHLTPHAPPSYHVARIPRPQRPPPSTSPALNAPLPSIAAVAMRQPPSQPHSPEPPHAQRTLRGGGSLLLYLRPVPPPTQSAPPMPSGIAASLRA